MTMLHNHGVHTNTAVTANSPDVITTGKNEKTCILISVAILADRNVRQKEAEKGLKYKSLCTEIQRMWNMKCMVYTRGNCSNGNSNKSFKKWRPSEENIE
jgi:hypothetical protein